MTLKYLADIFSKMNKVRVSLQTKQIKKKTTANDKILIFKEIKISEILIIPP